MSSTLIQEAYATSVEAIMFTLLRSFLPACDKVKVVIFLFFLAVLSLPDGGHISLTVSFYYIQKPSKTQRNFNYVMNLWPYARMALNSFNIKLCSLSKSMPYRETRGRF